jgi:hypothetical protein
MINLISEAAFRLEVLPYSLIVLDGRHHFPLEFIMHFQWNVENLSEAEILALN